MVYYFILQDGYICFDAKINKGTIHIQSLRNPLNFLNKFNDEDTKIIENKASGLKWGESFNSEWNFAQVRNTDNKSICYFGTDYTIIVVSLEEKYYKAQIGIENGRECKIIQEEDLI